MKAAAVHSRAAELARWAPAVLPGAGLKWLDDARARARAAFDRSGFPTPRTEAWRYTNLAPVLSAEWAPDAAPLPVQKERLNALLFGRESVHRLVFVNGRLDRGLSAPGTLPEGVAVLGVAEALADPPSWLGERLGRSDFGAHALASANTALMADGYVLRLAPGLRLEAPLEILWVGTGAERPPAYHPRNLIVAEAGAHATVIEHHVGLCIGGYFSNSVTEIALAADAVLRHCKVQDESREAVHIALTDAELGRNAYFDSFVFALGARLARNEIHVRLAGEGAHCRLNGGYLGRGDQHIDNTATIDHAVPRTTSKQLYKGVLDGRARGVFQGKIVVRAGAQKADGQQQNRALLLSDRAEINAKPELEILADDVKCSHGSAAGELDEQQLFYLRARGIPRDEARRLLVEAFLGEVVDFVALAGMRLSLEHNIQRWMRGG